MFLKNGVLWCQGNGYFWGITKKYPFPRHQRTPFFKNMNWTVIYNPNGIQNHAKRKKCVWVPSPNTSGLLTGLRIHRVHRIHQIHRSHQSRYKDLSDYSLSKQSWCQSWCQGNGYFWGITKKSTHFPDIRGLHFSKIWIELLSTTQMASKIMQNVKNVSECPALILVGY